MAARTAVIRFGSVRATTSFLPTTANGSIRAYQGRKFFNRSSVRYNDAAKPTSRSQPQNPITASMEESTTPSGHNTGVLEQDAKNAAVGHSLLSFVDHY
jgi:hypothetical protein